MAEGKTPEEQLIDAAFQHITNKDVRGAIDLYEQAGKRYYELSAEIFRTNNSVNPGCSLDAFRTGLDNLELLLFDLVAEKARSAT